LAEAEQQGYETELIGGGEVPASGGGVVEEEEKVSLWDKYKKWKAGQPETFTGGEEQEEGKVAASIKKFLSEVGSPERAAEQQQFLLDKVKNNK